MVDKNLNPDSQPVDLEWVPSEGCIRVKCSRPRAARMLENGEIKPGDLFRTLLCEENDGNDSVTFRWGCEWECLLGRLS